MLFGKRKKKLTEEEQKWNRMWELWVSGNVPSPYLELMNYESEVNNGGHSQYFFNTANGGDLAAEAAVLLKALPEPLLGNFCRAHDAFSAQEDIADDCNDELFEECDDLFYSHEALILDLLKICAASMEI